MLIYLCIAVVKLPQLASATVLWEKEESLNKVITHRGHGSRESTSLGPEGRPLRVTLEEVTVSSGRALRLGWTRRPRRGLGLAGRARHRGSALQTGALGTWGLPAAAPRLLCMASKGPDSKAQPGTQAPASPPEQGSPAGQSHGKSKATEASMFNSLKWVPQT
nr:PREDICTED: uncharacterized protein LOC109577752 isoform X2 [Bos indicus]